MKAFKDLPENLRTEEVRPYYEALQQHRGSLVLKRIFDFIVSLVMFCILLPFMIVIGRDYIQRRSFFLPGKSNYLWKNIQDYQVSNHGCQCRETGLSGNDKPGQPCYGGRKVFAESTVG